MNGTLLNPVRIRVALTLLCSWMLLGAPLQATAGILVETLGTGYAATPSTSKTQSRLLARRAAQLDAYRNAIRAVSGKTSSEDLPEEVLSGRILTTTLLSEEILPNEGVRVRMRILVDTTECGLERHRSFLHSGPRTPKIVSRQDWEKIIRNLVHFTPFPVAGIP